MAKHTRNCFPVLLSFLIPVIAWGNYDTHTGRFMTRDPIGYADGMNLYQYVQSSPVMSMDVIGHCTETYTVRKDPKYDIKRGGVKKPFDERQCMVMLVNCTANSTHPCCQGNPPAGGGGYGNWPSELFPELPDFRTPRLNPLDMLNDCEKNLDKAMQGSEYRDLQQAIGSWGCGSIPKPECDNDSPFNSCEPGVSGTTNPVTGQIIICADRLLSAERVEAVVIHEMTHAYDLCRNEVDGGLNPFSGLGPDSFHACSEIRAYMASGECNQYAGRPKEYQRCIINRAENSLGHYIDDAEEMFDYCSQCLPGSPPAPDFNPDFNVYDDPEWPYVH